MVQNVEIKVIYLFVYTSLNSYYFESLISGKNIFRECAFRCHYFTLADVSWNVVVLFESAYNQKHYFPAYLAQHVFFHSSLTSLLLIISVINLPLVIPSFTQSIHYLFSLPLLLKTFDTQYLDEDPDLMTGSDSTNTNNHIPVAKHFYSNGVVWSMNKLQELNRLSRWLQNVAVFVQFARWHFIWVRSRGCNLTALSYARRLIGKRCKLKALKSPYFEIEYSLVS